MPLKNIEVEVSDQVSRLPKPPVRKVSALQCYLAYISAILVGYLTWLFLPEFYPRLDSFWTVLVVTCISTITIWVYSIINNNSSIYDPYWVIAPPFLALLLIASGDGGLLEGWSGRKMIIFGLLLFWAFRYHIFYRWTGWRTGLVHEDWRYEDMRKAPLPYWLNSLIGMHLFPTLLVYFAFAPAAMVFLSDPNQQRAIIGWDKVGIVMAIAAVMIQFFSDRQLHRFRTTEAYRQGKTCDSGLWKFSRHPNYFGEVLFWLAMIAFTVETGIFAQHPWLVLTGPIAMAVFFRISAGMMDKRSMKRRTDYADYQRKTSALIPWWPKS